MSFLSDRIFWRIRTTGGSISRPQNEIFEEAADLAYYFHWPRSEIMSMTGKERLLWLKQIRRLHSEQNRRKQEELFEQLRYMDERTNQQ